MDSITAVKIAKIVIDGIRYLQKSNDHSWDGNNSIYYDSLNIANNYLDCIKDKEPRKVEPIMRSACQHLETAFASGHLSSPEDKNKLILSIIRLHHTLGDDYSIIKTWAGKICPCSEPDKELKHYLASNDLIDLIDDYYDFEREKEEQLIRDYDEKVQDEIDYANSNWGGFP